MTQLELLRKVKTGFLQICSIEFDFGGNFMPSISNLYQNFYDTTMDTFTFVSTYFSNSEVKFKEESETTSAGIKFMQTIQWSFPNNDKNRSLRIEEIRKVKLVKLVLSDGNRIILGRNDFLQNTPPTISFQSDENKTIVSFQTVSIFSFGFMESTYSGGFFPLDIPITFINF